MTVTLKGLDEWNQLKPRVKSKDQSVRALKIGLHSFGKAAETNHKDREALLRKI